MGACGSYLSPPGLLQIERAQAPAHLGPVRHLPASRGVRVERQARQGPAQAHRLHPARGAGLRLLPQVPLRPSAMKQVPGIPAGPPLPGPTETGSRIPVHWALLVGILCLSTIAAVVVSNGSPAVALAPCLVALLVGVVWVV